MKKSAKKSLNITDILKGKFLVEEGSTANWYYILFLIFLGFLMISSAHLIDRKTVRLTQLQEEVSQLKSKYANIHENLATKQNRNYIENLAIKDSLFDLHTQPFLIIDSIK